MDMRRLMTNFAIWYSRRTNTVFPGLFIFEASLLGPTLLFMHSSFLVDGTPPLAITLVSFLGYLFLLFYIVIVLLDSFIEYLSVKITDGDHRLTRTIMGRIYDERAFSDHPEAWRYGVDAGDRFIVFMFIGFTISAVIYTIYYLHLFFVPLVVILSLLGLYFGFIKGANMIYRAHKLLNQQNEKETKE